MIGSALGSAFVIIGIAFGWPYACVYALGVGAGLIAARTAADARRRPS